MPARLKRSVARGCASTLTPPTKATRASDARRSTRAWCAATKEEEHAVSTEHAGPVKSKTTLTRPETTETKEPTASYVDVRADEEDVGGSDDEARRLEA